jgi:hypothetical protein
MRDFALGEFSRDPRWLYIVECGAGGPVKFGIALNPHARVAALQEGCPYPLNLLAFMRGGLLLEQAIHRRFAALHMIGEWFERSPEIDHFLEKFGREAA